MSVTIDDVRDYLGAQPGSGPVNNEVLQQALDTATERVKSRCIEHFVWDPDFYPIEVDQSITMLAARLYRRRFSVNGYEGFGDLGIARVGGLDQDIEDLLTRYLRYDFA